MPQHFGAIDQGTTSTPFIVFDRAGRIVSSAQREHQQIYQPGWVEHDSEEIWVRAQEVIAEATEAAICGPATLLLLELRISVSRRVRNRKTGPPVYNAIV